MKGKKNVKREEPVSRPEDRQKKASQPGASGVPGSGGSREGNIGHQAGDHNDNPHR